MTFFSFGGGAEVESGSLLGLFRDSAPAMFGLPSNSRSALYFSTLPIVGLFSPRKPDHTRGLCWGSGNVGAIGRRDDDVILKLLLSIMRRQKELLFSLKTKKLKSSPHRHGACVLRNMIVSFSQCLGLHSKCAGLV